MGKLIEDPGLRDKLYVFADRSAAGRRLAAKLAELKAPHLHLFAIPAGGVPVGAEIAKGLGLPLDLIIVRKIQLPWTTEAGFGALDPDGQAILNEPLVERTGLTRQEIETQIKKTLETLKERETRFRGGRPYPDLTGQTAVIADDGLASGFTMRAAIRFLRGKGAQAVIVAVPTGSARTVQDLLPLTDVLVCLNVRGGWSFAVADAYENWYDLDEAEVMTILASLATA
ncbi:MAG: phosphoribosyltransferase family protein [Deltaproteobacteria bacterium]|nr:phosphoribosyltransferase family protein [Deltaproteobacteria bacterium]